MLPSFSSLICLKNKMAETDRLWMDSYGFIYSADVKRLLKGANVKGAYWIPEGVEEIEPGALIGCRIDTLHVPWTAHVHEHDQLAFSEDAEENEKMMPAVYFWTKKYANRDEETWAFEKIPMAPVFSIHVLTDKTKLLLPAIFLKVPNSVQLKLGL